MLKFVFTLTHLRLLQLRGFVGFLDFVISNSLVLAFKAIKIQTNDAIAVLHLVERVEEQYQSVVRLLTHATVALHETKLYLCVQYL